MLHPYQYSSSDSGSEKSTVKDLDYFSEDEVEKPKIKNPYRKDSDSDLDFFDEEPEVSEVKPSKSEPSKPEPSKSKSSRSKSERSRSKSEHSKSEIEPKSERSERSRSERSRSESSRSEPKSKSESYRQTQTPSRHLVIEDSACISVSKQFANGYKKTSENGNPEEFKYLLKKSPVAVLLHYLHYLFYINRSNLQNTRILMVLNDRYNVVSRYFLKALKSDTRSETAMKSLSKVSNMVSSKVNFKQIDDINHFTPEFLAMVTIQSGDLKSYDKIVSEWELSSSFKRSCDLIAAFFGIKSFFSDESRYENRQNLVISCICGGSVNTLSKIIRVTDSKWLSDFTLRKTREICIPHVGMLEYLGEKYNLEI